MSEIALEVGKTYETRNGRSRIKITHKHETSMRHEPTFTGTDQRGRVYTHSFYEDGRYVLGFSGIDLVREVTP